MDKGTILFVELLLDIGGLKSLILVYQIDQMVVLMTMSVSCLVSQVDFLVDITSNNVRSS